MNRPPRSTEEGNYRPIDGPSPEDVGAPTAPPSAGHQRDAAGENPEQSEQAAESDRQRMIRQFVDDAGRIELPDGTPITANVVRDLDVTERTIAVTVDCSDVTPAVGNRIGNQLRGVGLAIDGIDHVRIEHAGRWGRGEKSTIDGAETVFAVAGAKGGSGKTALTVALAHALRQAGVDVGVFDADFQTPTVTDLLGINVQIAATAGGRPEPAEVQDTQVLGIDLVAGDRPLAWRGAMTHDVLDELLGSAAWNDREVLLVDLPSGLGEVSQRLFERIAVDGAVVVTTPAGVSVDHTERTLGLLDAYDVPVQAIVENLAGDEVIQSDDRPAGSLVEPAPGDPEVVSVPFDPGLQSGLETPPQVSETTETAIRRVVSAIESRVAAIRSTVPEDAVDLSGLPIELQETQAVLETAQETEDRPPLVVDGDDDIPALLADQFDCEVAVSVLGDDRHLLQPGGGAA